MKHKSLIQVRFADIDMLGHVNNAHFLTYMEIARISYFTEVINDAVDWKTEGVILAKAIIDYRRPVFIENALFVYIAIDQISSKSFNFSYRFIVEKDSKEIICAEASTIMVCFDYTINQSIVMPQKWKDRIMKYEELEVK